MASHSNHFEAGCKYGRTQSTLTKESFGAPLDAFLAMSWRCPVCVRKADAVLDAWEPESDDAWKKADDAVVASRNTH